MFNNQGNFAFQPNPNSNFQQRNNESLEQAYQELMRLKGNNTAPQIGAGYRTVFSDIAAEFNDCSEAEKEFVLHDEAYVKANINYQQQFNAFLIEVMGLQFINSQYGKSAEEVLVTLKDARKRFVNTNQAQARDVAAQNAILIQQNEELQRQLAQLLGGGKDNNEEQRQRNII